MPKGTKTLGYIKAPACESRGFVNIKRGCIILTHPQEDLNERVKRTRNLIEEWLKDEESELSLRDCGPAENGAVYWIFKNGYQENREEMRLLFMHLRKLIRLLRDNDDICKVWLKWDDITDDLFWDTNDTIFDYFNRKEYKKEEYVLIHENKKPIKSK